jgi:hypothetical protein
MHQNNITLLLDNNALFLLGNNYVITNCYLLKRRKEIKIKKRRNVGRRVLSRESNVQE